MTDWRHIAGHITQVTGELFHPGLPQALGGGCINRAFRLGDGRRQYFVKLNTQQFLDIFEAEAAGLAELLATGALRVPAPIASGVVGVEAYLVLEHIPLQGGGDPARAGERLAALHRTQGIQFGWWRDNHIGATPQANTPAGDWARFWRQRRLGPQLDLAARNGYGGRLQRRGERLLARFPVLIDHQPTPSLLHGDLWGGNLAYDADGQPVVFDPAVYYGDRETDLAMTELFGGFPSRFYTGYQAVWPLGSGYQVRKTLYNLYHVLNHLNLFGGGYLPQAEDMIERLLAELG